MELIAEYFPDLNPLQKEQFTTLGRLYTEWNEKINLVSRKDIGHIYLHHILHSLALAKYNPFKDSLSVIDVGTGGGLPGIPLAIMYPEVSFTLLDSTAKKIHVVNAIASEIGLMNVTAVHSRMEEFHGEFDIITCRAVSSLSQLIAWTQHLSIANRWIVLKGGDKREIRKELLPVFSMKFIPVNDFFKEEYFNEKYIVDISKH